MTKVLTTQKSKTFKSEIEYNESLMLDKNITGMTKYDKTSLISAVRQNKSLQ